MAVSCHTVALDGVDARPVEVQCALSPGLPAFSIVGLPDKAVSEARERVRAALSALSISLPSKRITINLAPADLPKEGSHFDLPIALALLSALDMLPADKVADTVALGELSLDGRLVAVPGALPAALMAAAHGKALMCPANSGPEAAWVAATDVFAPDGLDGVLRHLSGQAPLPAASPGAAHADPSAAAPDFSDVRGQETAKRALEIAAAGRHHILMVGPPGSGKSMMARRLPGILPPLSAQEALETSLVHSVAGRLKDGAVSRARPFQDIHHTASSAAITGGGRSAGPGAVSLAHNGVLFLDELPEFNRNVLDCLRQPLETGQITVSRAAAHVTYPCRVLLVAAANPCRCGYMADAGRACARAPVCGQDYLGKVSGPLLDRFDLRLEVPPVAFTDLDLPPPAEGSAEMAARVAQARHAQNSRFEGHAHLYSNADADGPQLDEIAELDTETRALLSRAADRFGLSARGYQRVRRVARTIADLEGATDIALPHVAEALSYRLAMSTPR